MIYFKAGKFNKIKLEDEKKIIQIVEQMRRDGITRMPYRNAVIYTGTNIFWLDIPDD
jgi:hypothetical protein